MRRGFALYLALVPPVPYTCCATPFPHANDNAMVSTLASPITLAHRVHRSDEVMIQEIGGEAVLLDLASESYFGLDPVGTRIWALLGEPAELKLVHEVLCDEYDAEPERIGADLLLLIERLVEAGLVKVT